MAVPRPITAALGAVAFLPTTAMLGIHIILARSPADRARSVKATGALAAVFEAFIFVLVPFLTISHLVPWAPRSERRLLRRLWFVAGLLLCTIAWAVSVANIVCLSRVADDPHSTILGSKADNFVVGSSIALGFAFAAQLVFFIFHFLSGRTPNPPAEVSILEQKKGSMLGWRIKTVPYHETTPISAKSLGSGYSFGLPTTPRSIGGHSRSGTMNSMRSSFSHALRPITSKTNLLSLSQHFSRKSASLDLGAQQESRPQSLGAGFEYWDTPAVDPENRRTVLESSTPPPSRSLATIPASPSNSRSSSPSRSLDVLEPPNSTRRSRSYSSVSSRAIQAQRIAFTQQKSHSEAHIHPLFRSDSPAPPLATPGTVVVAAPNAGKIISDRQSIRSLQSLRRLRSESLPAGASPLSRAASCDSFVAHRRQNSMSCSIREEAEATAGAPAAATAAATATATTTTTATATATSPAPALATATTTGPPAGGGTGTGDGTGKEDGERKRVLPIPEFILNAGARLSFAVYQSRKNEETAGESPASEQGPTSSHRRSSSRTAS
ncbi:hypothetical protein VTH06DRAFT_3406 [Thermothelomyces fergusii]